jgi:hypothetical protein
LQADTSIKRKNKKAFDQKKDLFINLINQFEYAISKSYLIEKDFAIDLSKYEENFYQVIDSLILLSFGKEVKPEDMSKVKRLIEAKKKSINLTF